MADLTNAELANALDGLYAYDTGAVDSGIHDESLRAQVYAQVLAKSPQDRRAFVCGLVVNLCLSTDAQDQGYGPEDAKALLVWLEDEMPESVIYTAIDFKTPEER